MVRIRVQTALLIIFILVSALPIAAQEGAKPMPQEGVKPSTEEFTGYIVNVRGTMPRAQSTHIRLLIKEYTTDAEVNELAVVLKEKGQDKFRDALWKIEKGSIQVGNSLGYPISVARSLQGPQGRIIRVVTDRPIPLIESMNGLRSLDYPFGIVELKIDAQGKGEGTIIAAARSRVGVASGREHRRGVARG